jgi:hypothetical protein
MLSIFNRMEWANQNARWTQPKEEALFDGIGKFSDWRGAKAQLDIKRIETDEPPT